MIQLLNIVSLYNFRKLLRNQKCLLLTKIIAMAIPRLCVCSAMVRRDLFLGQMAASYNQIVSSSYLTTATVRLCWANPRSLSFKLAGEVNAFLKILVCNWKIMFTCNLKVMITCNFLIKSKCKLRRTCIIAVKLHNIWCLSEIIVSIKVKDSFLNNILFEHLSCCIHVLHLLLKIVKLSRIYHVNSI